MLGYETLVSGFHYRKSSILVLFVLIEIVLQDLLGKASYTVQVE